MRRSGREGRRSVEGFKGNRLVGVLAPITSDDLGEDQRIVSVTRIAEKTKTKRYEEKFVRFLSYTKKQLSNVEKPY